MAYSAELIVSGETYTANILKGNPGDTGAKGADGVAIVPVYNNGTKLVDQISVLKFTGGGKTLTASGNEITIDIPTSTNDYNQLINKPTSYEWSSIVNVPDSITGFYEDLRNKPFIPTDLTDLTDSQGILSSFTFDGSFNSLTDRPSTLFGYGITDAFDEDYNSLTNKPDLSVYLQQSDLEPYALKSDHVSTTELTTALADYVSNTALTTALDPYALKSDHVSTTELTTALADYVSNSGLDSVLTGYITTSGLNLSLSNYVLISTFNSTLSNYVLTTTLANYATQSFVTSTVAQLVDAAPTTLDTLNELAAALGDDPNFATTIATQLGLKEDSVNLKEVARSGSYFDLGDTPPPFNQAFSEKTTSDLTEGTRLYYTDARVQAKLGSVSGHILPDTDVTYDIGSPTARFKDLYLSGNSIYLGDGLVLSNDNGTFAVTDANSNPVTVSLANNTTSDLAEGTNLYYTTARVNNDFDVRLAGKTTDNLTEGPNNLYWTVPRGEEMFDVHLLTKTTSDLAEGDNLYYTTDRANTDFNASLALKSTTDLAEGSNLYWTVPRGEEMFDNHLGTKSTTDLAEGTHLYYTTARVNNDFDVRLATKTTSNLTEGANLYYTEARVNTNFSYKTTDLLSEGTGNLYYTDQRVQDKIDVYVVGGTGVGISNGEISIGQDVSTTSNVTFNDVNATGNVVIGGNLTVSGTTITLDAQNLSVTDAMIYLNNGSTVANPDLGIAGNYNDGTYAHTGVFRDATDGTWKFYQGYLPEPDASSFIDTTHASFAYAPVRASHFTGNLTGNVLGNVTGNVIGSVSNISNHTTSDLPEGTNLYYTGARVGQYLVNNSYATQSYVTNSIATAATNYATAAQGATADSAVQPEDLATVATTGLYSSLSGKPNLVAVATSGLYSDLIGKPNFAAVATSGLYSDLAGSPVLAAVATTGQYSSLIGRPSLATVATTGEYSDLLNLPTLSVVSSTGQYSDLIGKPTLSVLAGTGSWNDILNKPNFATIATTGAYTDLIGAPSLATVATTGSYSSLTGRPTLGTASAQNVEYFATAAQGLKADTAIQSLVGYATETYVNTAISSLVDTAPATLNTLNELAAALGDDPNFATTISTALGLKANTADLADVAVSGDYANLINKPNLGSAAYADTTAFATASQGALADTSVQPGDLATVATSGDYNNLINRPTLGTAAATNSTAYATAAQGDLADSAVQPGDLATVATTGLYSDLGSKPTLGTAAAKDVTFFATATQGALADTALQSVAFEDLTTTPTTLAGYGITDAADSTWRLDYFTESTSAQLASVISDETGSGSLVFSSSPIIDTPTISDGSFTGGTFTNPTLSNPLVPIIKGSVVDNGTLTLRGTDAEVKGDVGVIIDGGIASTSINTGDLIVSGGIGVGGRLSTREVYTERITEKLNLITAPSNGVINYSYTSGTTHYHTSITEAFTPNFTNVPTTEDRTIVFVIMVSQDSTPYAPVAVQIDGVAATVNWINNALPTPTANNVDQFTFTLIRSQTTWTVLGNVTTYGATA